MRFYAAVTASTASAGGGQTVAATATDPSRVWLSPLDQLVDLTVTVGTSYFNYVGYVPSNAVLGFMEAMQTALSGTLGPLELAVLKSVDAPAGLGTQSLSVLAAVTVMDPTIILGDNLIHRNQTQFDVTLATAAHCWCGFRFTGPTIIRPRFLGLWGDFQSGFVKIIPVSPALTSTDTFHAFTVSAIASVQPAAVGMDWRLRLV
jgi:hypothetical protein